jgi:hypothetical protein
MMPIFVETTLQAQSGLMHGTEQETRADWQGQLRLAPCRMP